MQDHWLIVGTYTDDGRSKGIYRLEFDVVSGQFGGAQLLVETDNPSFLVASDEVLFAVNENGGDKGAVSAFAIDRTTGELDFLSRQSTGGAYPCHIAFDADQNMVIAANYGTGTVATFSADMTMRTGLHQHAGSGPDASRQEGPHAHSTAIVPGSDVLYAPDLGADLLVAYRREGGLLPVPELNVTCPEGSGPRHMVFNAAGSRAWLITELSNEILTFDCSTESGALSLVHRTSTLPADFNGASFCADIHLSADERFLYGSNRGHDSLAIFALDADTGHPTAIGHQSTKGRHPRNFTLDPAGNHLLVANRDSDNIVSFQIDEDTGLLTKIDVTEDIPKPVCLLFTPRTS